RRIEINVRIQLLLAFDECFDPLRHVEPGGVAGAFAELLRHLPEMCRAWILRSVDAMPEPWNLLLAREFPAHRFIHSVSARVLTEVEKHLHHFRVSAAVQRPFQ